MRAFLWACVKRVLFLLDAEKAHRLTVHLIRLGRLGGVFGPLPLRIVSGASAPSAKPAATVFGVDFQSRVGLAAGFDKEAELVSCLPALGFGFAEIGTVTPRPQPGNDKPRLFRDPARRCVFNRMGFNSGGAQAVAERLTRERQGLPTNFRVGVNIGKNKETPLENAHRDYADAASAFEGLADYLVINVSSPNTPGLRSLQTLEALHPIVDGVNGVISRWKSRPPLLLKLAPELTANELREIMEAAEKWGVNGWILTNTLGGSREGQVGGWSGAILTETARKSLTAARAITRLPIISVGGIMDGAEAQRRIHAGADLVQLYTGWIYGGPNFPAEVVRAISKP